MYYTWSIDEYRGAFNPDGGLWEFSITDPTGYVLLSGSEFFSPLQALQMLLEAAGAKGWVIDTSSFSGGASKPVKVG